MFTGLVQALGTVIRVVPAASQTLLALRCPGFDRTTLELGESIAVQGACLSVVSREPDGFAAQASTETMTRTTLGGIRPGDRVHLERALRLCDRLGGHLVLGHVDGIGRIVRTERRGEVHELTIAAPPELTSLLAYKGSIAVDGVSLTVNRIEGSSFTVVIIPHTVHHTLLPERRSGDPVNLEGDVLGKYVLAALAQGVVPGSLLGVGTHLADRANSPRDTEQGLVQALRAAGFGSPDQGDR